jgi:hypothetical protein
LIVPKPSRFRLKPLAVKAFKIGRENPSMEERVFGVKALGFD